MCEMTNLVEKNGQCGRSVTLVSVIVRVGALRHSPAPTDAHDGAVDQGGWATSAETNGNSGRGERTPSGTPGTRVTGFYR